MNGMHDMGGMDGFGPIRREDNEPVFHADWERRMFALASAIPFAVPMSDDHFRQEIERVAPATYLKSDYYELWYRAHMALLQQRGVIEHGRPEGTKPLAAETVMAAIGAGASTRMPADGITARFAVGDRVTARNIHPSGHTRLPRYARGRSGVIDADRGVFSFADSNARGDGPCPQHLYTVAFAGEALWGEDAGNDTVYLDLWESYLDPATR